MLAGTPGLIKWVYLLLMSLKLGYVSTNFTITGPSETKLGYFCLNLYCGNTKSGLGLTKLNKIGLSGAVEAKMGIGWARSDLNLTSWGQVRDKIGIRYNQFSLNGFRFDQNETSLGYAGKKISSIFDQFEPVRPILYCFRKDLTWISSWGHVVDTIALMFDQF
jgi:hypothetical protein